MKTKITLLIDSDLLSIAKSKKPDIVLADELESRLAEILGVQKLWVDIKNKTKLHLKDAVKAKSTLAIYAEVTPLLKTEFTSKEFKQAMIDIGCIYTENSWKAVPDKKLKRLIQLGKIERIGEIGSGKYRKISFLDIGENKISNKIQGDRKTLENTMH